MEEQTHQSDLEILLSAEEAHTPNRDHEPETIPEYRDQTKQRSQHSPSQSQSESQSKRISKESVKNVEDGKRLESFEAGVIDVAQVQNMSREAIRALMRVEVDNDDSILEFFFHFPLATLGIDSGSITSQMIKAALKVVLDPNRIRNISGDDSSEAFFPYIIQEKALSSVLLLDYNPCKFPSRVIYQKLCKLICTPEHILRQQWELSADQVQVLKGSVLQYSDCQIDFLFLENFCLVLDKFQLKSSLSNLSFINIDKLKKTSFYLGRIIKLRASIQDFFTQGIIQDLRKTASQTDSYSPSVQVNSDSYLNQLSTLLITYRHAKKPDKRQTLEKERNAVEQGENYRRFVQDMLEPQARARQINEEYNQERIQFQHYN